MQAVQFKTRAELIQERNAMPSKGYPDFCPSSGICYSCRTDLVAFYGDNYPAADITGCPKCHRSYCD